MDISQLRPGQIVEDIVLDLPLVVLKTYWADRRGHGIALFGSEIPIDGSHVYSMNAREVAMRLTYPWPTLEERTA